MLKDFEGIWCAVSAFDTWRTESQQAKAIWLDLVGDIARIWALFIGLLIYSSVHSFIRYFQVCTLFSRSMCDWGSLRMLLGQGGMIWSLTDE